MAEPELRREGNLRMASLPTEDWPADPRDLYARVLATLGEQGEVHPYGPVSVLIDLPPGDEDPRSWRCQVGSALTGLPRPAPPLLMEDYAKLQALVLPHHEPVAQLATTWRLLDDHARAMGWVPRPYWRVSLRRSLTADGNLFPQTEVAIFLDR